MSNAKISEQAVDVIVKCDEHVRLVRATWGHDVAGTVAMSLTSSLAALFRLAAQSGAIGAAGDDLSLWVDNPHIYAEMVPHRMSVDRLAAIIGGPEQSPYEVVSLLAGGEFVHPVEWSVHS